MLFFKCRIRWTQLLLQPEQKHIKKQNPSHWLSNESYANKKQNVWTQNGCKLQTFTTKTLEQRLCWFIFNLKYLFLSTTVPAICSSGCVRLSFASSNTCWPSGNTVTSLLTSTFGSYVAVRKQTRCFSEVAKSRWWCSLLLSLLSCLFQHLSIYFIIYDVASSSIQWFYLRWSCSAE